MTTTVDACRESLVSILTARIGAVSKAIKLTNVTRAWNTLHLHLEVVHILRLEDVGQHSSHIGVQEIYLSCQIALETAGVICQGPVRISLGNTSGQVKSSGAKVDCQILEGPRVYAASACTDWKFDDRQTILTTETN